MKEADKMAPGETDPNQLAALEDAKRKTRQSESGTDTTTQEAIKSIDQSTTATQKQLAGVTGGNVTGTVSAMLQALKAGGNVKNQAFAGAGQRGLQMGSVANEIRKNIGQRKLDIQQFRSVQRRAEGADMLKTGMGNLQAGIFGSAPTEGGGSGTSEGGLSQLLQQYSPAASSSATAPKPTRSTGAASTGDTPLSLGTTTFAGGPSVLPSNFGMEGIPTS